LERHKVLIYVGGILAGVLVGLLAPAAGPGLQATISPVLGALLYVTFRQVPARELVRSLRAGRFLGAALVVNFVVVPLVVAAMFGFLAADRGVRLFMGPALAEVIEFGPFVVLIVIPLALAWLIQAWAARTPAGQRFSDLAGTLIVPLMVTTLLVVVASQVPKLGDDATAVLAVVPFYAAFLLVMALLGLAVARAFRLDPGAGRAIIFTGATRNSLVVLPLALALPDSLAIAAVLIVTQTLAEVIGMVAHVRTVPWLL
jgi:arsenite transporter